MRNSTFSLSPAVAAIFAVLLTVMFVLNQIDWQMINASIAHQTLSDDDFILEHCITEEEVGTALPQYTRLYTGDEYIQMRIDTSNYLYKIQDSAGTKAGFIEYVDWVGDTCIIHTDENLAIATVGDRLIGVIE